MLSANSMFFVRYVSPVAVRGAAAAGEDDIHSLASASLTGAK